MTVPSENAIIDCLKVNYNIEVQSIIALSDGADFNAVVYKIQTSNQTYFLKLKRGHENHKILELLHNSGIEQIIPPVKSIDSRSFQQLGDFCATLYPFIEGVNGFSQKLTEKQWVTLGKALRQVHDFEVPPTLLKQIKHETYSPKWRQFVQAFYDNIPASRDAVASKFLDFMKEHKLVIQRLVDRADALCNTIKEQPAKFVLCHSDIHAGNVLIKESREIYIIDWDEPIMAPKERDLMFIGAGVANVWNEAQEAVSFYRGYGNTEIDHLILSYYRHERIVQDIAEYAQALLLTDSSQKNRSEMYTHFTDMFAPHGVVEIALAGC